MIFKKQVMIFSLKHYIFITWFVYIFPVFWPSRLTAHSFSQPLGNEPITRMSQRRLPMITRPIISEVEFVNLPLVEFHSSFSAGVEVIHSPIL